jgi:hypothetical protein
MKPRFLLDEHINWAVQRQLPKAVYEEVVEAGRGRPGSKEVRETKRRGLIPSITLLLDQLLAAGVRISLE